MNAEASRQTRHTMPTRESSRPTPTFSRPRPRPMPRSTTRVIWTVSQGTTVQFGDIA